MIVGNGMIANSFDPYKNNSRILIFASGVSNSNNTSSDNFYREKLLLENTINSNPEKVLVYFSTCSVYDNSLNKSSYTIHKKTMEKIVKKKCNQFYIFRLPQVVGNTNSPTLVKFLFESILNNKQIDINKNSTRNLINVNDVFLIADYLIKNNIYINQVTNIATPFNVSVVGIVQIIEKITGLSMDYNIVNFGHSFDINIDKIQRLNIGLTDIFSCNYLHSTLKSYFQMRADEKSKNTL